MIGGRSDDAARIEALEQQLADAEAALERERSHTEVERLGRERALRSAEKLRKAGKRRRSDSAPREVARLQRELDKVYASNTWKAGRLVWWLGTAPRRLIGSLRRRSAAPAVSPSIADDTTGGGKPVPRIERHYADYVLIEDTVMRRRYQDALDRRAFSDPASPRNLVLTVYTNDLDEGRGDVYVAIGLGRYLERLGYEAIYLAQERWYDLPNGTAIYMAMHDWVEPTRIPTDVVTVAWIRNRTDAWAQLSWLPVYDMVLCSSELTEETIRQVYPGRTAVLPVAVDAELFKPQGRDEDRHGVVTTQNNWGTERIAHQYLRSIEADLPLAIYGQDRGIAPELQQYVQGPVSFFALPSLYSQAAIVVDDLLVQNGPFGNTNSRVFEALACGAVVLTNQARGLDRVGLELAPVYRDASQLADLIGGGLAGELRADVKLLRRAVLEQHTFEVRATDLAGHLEQMRSTPAMSERTVPEIIGFYPDYRNSPYQEMMWSRLRNDGAIPIALQDDFDPSSLLDARSARKLFHLNWTAPILGPAQDEAARIARSRRFLEMLDAVSDAGVPTVWTVHNVLPHECADPDAERQLRQQIADRIDAIHVMCERTIAETAPHYVLPPNKVRVIPHPSYIDVYPNLIGPESARYELGIDPDEFVYLFFGQIRHYKGVDLLLDAFDGVYRSRPRSRLIVVGEPGRFLRRTEIEQRVRSHPGVIAHLYPIADDDIQLHMNAADVIVLPYREILNSGVMMLAYSYARPVIVAAIGCVPGQVDDTTGITFSWEEGSPALRRAMLEGERLRDEAIRAAAYRMAQRRHYLDISGEFADLVDEARDVAAARLGRRHRSTDTTR